MTRVMRNVIASFGLCFCFGSVAVAAPILSDSRIKTLIYNENEVYNVTTHYGYQANVEFGTNEMVEAVSVGDRIGWQIVPAGRRLFIRAMEEKGHTNMTVVTNRRAYQFDLRSSASNAVFGSAELTYVLRFFYPEAQGTQPVQFAAPKTVSRVAPQAARRAPVTSVAQAPLRPLPVTNSAPTAVRRPVVASRNTRLPPRNIAFPAPLPQVQQPVRQPAVQVPPAATPPVVSQPVQSPGFAQQAFQTPAPQRSNLQPAQPLPQAALSQRVPFARAGETPPPVATVPPATPVQVEPLSPLQPIATPFSDVPATNNASAANRAVPVPPVNFRYTYSGADAAAPVKIFDDGRSTYFKFNQPPVGTRFSVISSNGEEYEVPHRFNAEGFAVIDTVAAKVRLSQKKGQVVVYNEVLG